MTDINSVTNGNGTTAGKENIGGGGGGKYDGPFTPFDKKFADYFSNLMKEKESLDADKYPLIHRLVQNELSSISKGAGGLAQNNGYIDLYGEAPITLSVKAMPPSKIFPQVNYAGRIIGPKGAYLKALKKETKTNMTLLGKGVMKDKEKEEQLRRGSDPKYYHLNEDMHMAILVTAPAPEAYAKIAYALKCLKELTLTDSRASEEIPWIARNLQGDTPASGQGQAPQTYAPGPGGGQSPPPVSQHPSGGSYPPPSDFRPPSIHEGRPPPGVRPVYDYGHGAGGGLRPYDPTPPHHYSDGGPSGVPSADLYAPKPSAERVERSPSQSQRYAPY